MPFSGPSRRFEPVRPFDPYAFDQALTREEDAAKPRLPEARIDTSLMDSQNRDVERSEAGRAQLAMTPGVMEGMAPGGQGGVADSPYLEPRSFQQYGKQYSYDPMAAAKAEGATAGARETSVDEARFSALKKIPGFSELQAGRMVYGRAGTSTDEEQEPFRRAMAEYSTNPNLATRKALFMAGGRSSDLLSFRLPEDEQFTKGGNTPERGTPEYEAMLGREMDVRNAHDLTPGFAPKKDRVRVVTHTDGTQYELNEETNTLTPLTLPGGAPQ